MFSYRSSKGKHINLLELERLSSLLRRVTREGVRARRLLVLVDSRVVLATCRKEHGAHERSISCSGNWGSGALPMTLLWNWSGCPPGRIQRMPLHGTSPSITGMHHYRSSRPFRPRSSRQFMPLRNWICSVSRCRPRRIQSGNMCEHSNHPVSSTAREQVLSAVYVTLRSPASEGIFLRLQMSSGCSLKRLKTVVAM